MTNPAINIDSIVESANHPDEHADCEIFDFEDHHRDSLSEIFNTELDARQCRAQASNGFGDY